MNNEKQETIADIVAKMRAFVHVQNADPPSACYKLARRIEAAHFRECEALREERNRAGLTEREKLAPRIRELEAKNARLRAALKPVLECLCERPCFAMPDCQRSLAVRAAQRIYNEGEKK